MKISRSTAPALRPVQAVAGALGALWAAVIGLVIVAIPVFIAQSASTDSGAGWSSALKGGSAAWLVANDVPIRLGDVTYSLLPWGLLVIPVVLLVLAGRWAAHVAHAQSRGERAVVIGAAVIIYALAGLVASRLCASDTVGASALRASLTTGVVALLAFGWGVLRVRISARRASLSPARLLTLRAGGLAIMILIAVSAVLLLVALLSGFSTAVDMQKALAAGPVGGFVLMLLGLGYLPMMLTWTIAYTAGTAVTIGAGSVVSPFVTSAVPTELPPFPLLSALPSGSSTAQWFLPLLVVAAGVLVGLWISRRIVLPARGRAGVAAGASAIAAIAVLLAALISTGAVGVDRLRHLGPAPVLTAIAVLVLLGIGSIPTALAFGRRPLLEATEVEVSDAAVDATEMYVAETEVPVTPEPVATASSVLDASSTQIIPLPTMSQTPTFNQTPRNSESTDE